MAFDQHQIRANILKARDDIEEIRKVSGAPGLAIGVIHRGAIVFEDYHGYRDVQSSLPVDRNTIFHIASLTKGITAAAVGILVDRGDLKWDTPVDEILPISRDTPQEKSKLSVVDFLSHRTGVTWADALYLQSNNSIQLAKEESLRTFEYLPMVAAPRSRFLYNNHAYNIPGLIVETLSKQSYGDFLKDHIFTPLEMTRTFTSRPPDANVAIPYNILVDGTPYQIPFCDVSDSTMMFSAISVRSCMADLLRLYQAYLRAMEPLIPGNTGDDCAPTTDADGGSLASVSVIQQASQLFRPFISRAGDTIHEQTYALGWNRTQLPGVLDFGWNASMVEAMPLLGTSTQGKLAIWHGGNMPGTTAAVILLPETATAVVVLHNSLGRCDAADWTAQLLVDCIFTGQPQHDYVALASEAFINGIQRMQKVRVQLEKERELGTTHRPLHEYVGNYENAIRNWVIEIGVDDESRLFLRFQRRLDEQHTLRHYHHDVFVWNMSYDETVKRAQYCRPYAYYKMEFESDVNGSITFMRWRHDPNIPDGEIFTKFTR